MGRLRVSANNGLSPQSDILRDRMHTIEENVNDAILQCRELLTDTEYHEAFDFSERHGEYGLAIETLVDILIEKNAKLNESQFKAISDTFVLMHLDTDGRLERLQISTSHQNMSEFKKPNRDTDLEVELYLLPTEQGGRKKPLWQGCRLPHDFGLPEEFNDGMYEFLGEPPRPGGSQKAHIWLLAPERNQGRISQGFEFRVWAGGFIGHGKVIRIINPLLSVDAKHDA